MVLNRQFYMKFEELKTFLFQNRFLFEYNSDPFYCSWNEYQESDEYYGEFQMGGEIYEVGYIYEDFDLEKKFLVTKKRGTKCFVPGKEFLDRAVHNEWPWL